MDACKLVFEGPPFDGFVIEQWPRRTFGLPKAITLTYEQDQADPPKSVQVEVSGGRLGSTPGKKFDVRYQLADGDGDTVVTYKTQHNIVGSYSSESTQS